MASLDTSVLIDLGRRPGTPHHQEAQARIREVLHAGGSLYTSRINQAELLVGVERSGERQRELQRVQSVLAPLVILELDHLAAQVYAKLKAHLLARRQPSGDCDMFIAAIALSNNQPVLTRNPRHFATVPGLKVIDY